MTWKLIVEGGGDGTELRKRCREGFRKLLEKAGFGGNMPRVVAGAGRNRAFGLFKTQWLTKQHGELVILLIDSEKPMNSSEGKWTQLQKMDGWEKPEGATEDDVFLMVQVMETWLLADRETWTKFYKQGFRPECLPVRANLEAEPKQDVYKKIQSATANASPKGSYGKGAHSFELLGLVDVEKVRTLPHAAEFFDTMNRRTSEQG